MKDHTTITEWCEEMGCPVHGRPIRKVYSFGQFRDAEVCTFRGCGCAVCINSASLQCGVPLGHEYTYHTSYGSASGRALLIKAQEAVANRPFMTRD